MRWLNEVFNTGDACLASASYCLARPLRKKFSVQPRFLLNSMYIITQERKSRLKDRKALTIKDQRS